MEGLYELPKPKKKPIGSKAFAAAAFSLLIALWIATQSVASAFKYQAALGIPIFGHVYSPLDFLGWYMQFYSNPKALPILESGLQTLGLTFALLASSSLLCLYYFRETKRNHIHGSAHWATLKEVKETGLFNKSPSGVYVGAFKHKDKVHYLTHDGPEHLLCFAPTRSGKGVGLVIPTLLSWRHSVVVHDIKGENWAITSGFRQKIGQKVLKFDPTSSDGSSVRYNPLEEIRLGTELEVKDVQNIATMIVDPDGKGLTDHWAKTGYALLVGTILHVLYAESDKTLRGVASFLSQPGKTVEDVMNEMMDTPHLGDKPHPVIAESAAELLNKSENERSGVISTAMSFLALYRDPIVAKATEVSEFKVSDLMNHESPVSLYLVVPPSDKDRLKPLLRLMLNQIVRQLTEKMEFKDGRSIASYKHRLLLLIDEFPALGRLDILQEALAFIAGYGMKAYLITQDLSQLYAAYGKDEAILSNCHVRVAYAPNKIETAELLSKMSGTMTVEKETESFSGKRFDMMLGNTSRSTQASARALLIADEVTRLPPDDMLIFVAGHAPVYGKKIKYYEDYILGQRSKIPCPSTSDCLRGERAQVASNNQPMPEEERDVLSLEEDDEPLVQPNVVVATIPTNIPSVIPMKMTLKKAPEPQTPSGLQSEASAEPSEAPPPCPEEVAEAPSIPQVPPSPLESLEDDWEENEAQGEDSNWETPTETKEEPHAVQNDQNSLLDFSL